MPRDSLRPDVHRLVVPRRPEALALPSLPARRFDEDSAVQTTDDSQVSYSSSDDAPVRTERWDGFDEDAPRPVDVTPLPDVRLLWPLLADLAPAPAEPAKPSNTVPCPGCGAELTVGFKSWCLRCGYDSEQAQRGLEPEEGGVRQAVVVLVFAAAGCLAIVAATAFRRDLVPDRTDLRMWWIGYQGLAGFLLYAIGHAIAVGLTAKHWDDDAQPSCFDPLAVWRYALYHLPKTRWAITYGVWGATALGCAFVLFCLNDFSIKDKTAKQKIRSSEIVSEESEVGSVWGTRSDAPANPGGASEGGPSVAEEGGAVADAPRLRPHSLKGAAVVIGYVPDPTNPDRVARVMLGVRSSSGGIRFAGVAQLDSSVKDGEALGRLRALGRPAATPGYNLGRDVIPVEPKLLADIRYAELDGRGIFRDTVITGVADAGGR
ncbi:MAG TPA: hypothetical protein VFG68_07945 [Fimbriiglobus sp.]|nr:hypothetical protein [Fimbriiglobus sp.]